MSTSFPIRVPTLGLVLLRSPCTNYLIQVPMIKLKNTCTSPNFENRTLLRREMEYHFVDNFSPVHQGSAMKHSNRCFLNDLQIMKLLQQFFIMSSECSFAQDLDITHIMFYLLYFCLLQLFTNIARVSQSKAIHFGQLSAVVDIELEQIAFNQSLFSVRGRNLREQFVCVRQVRLYFPKNQRDFNVRQTEARIHELYDEWPTSFEHAHIDVLPASCMEFYLYILFWYGFRIKEAYDTFLHFLLQTRLSQPFFVDNPGSLGQIPRKFDIFATKQHILALQTDTNVNHFSIFMFQLDLPYLIKPIQQCSRHFQHIQPLFWTDVVDSRHQTQSPVSQIVGVLLCVLLQINTTAFLVRNFSFLQVYDWTQHVCQALFQFFQKLCVRVELQADYDSLFIFSDGGSQCKYVAWLLVEYIRQFPFEYSFQVEPSLLKQGNYNLFPDCLDRCTVHHAQFLQIGQHQVAKYLILDGKHNMNFYIQLIFLFVTVVPMPYFGNYLSRTKLQE